MNTKTINDFNLWLNNLDSNLRNKLLSHKSRDNTNNYESFEILGDAYLNYFVVKHIRENFTKEPSEITKQKKIIVSNLNISSAFEKLHLNDKILLGKSFKDEPSDKIKADYIEAIIGLMDLTNYKNIDNFVKDIAFSNRKKNSDLIDYKSEFKELIQQNSKKYDFRQEEKFDENKKIHSITVSLLDFQTKAVLMTKTNSDTSKLKAANKCYKEILEKLK